MVTSSDMSSRPVKHVLSNGRTIDFSVEGNEDIGETFVQLTKATRNEDHLKFLVGKSTRGLRTGHSPTLCESGVGGTYFMHDEANRTIGVFKPHDEEMWCMNNPKGFTPKSPSFKETSVFRGAEAGEAAFRECAAYLLDHENYAGVPATGLVVCSHPTFSSGSGGNSKDHLKIGSFQEFKDHDYDAEDISSMKYEMFPVHEVHKIAILDIRLLNTDRHGGNILVKVNRSRNGSKEDIFSDCDSDDEPPLRRGKDDSYMMFNMDMDADSDEERDSYMLSPPRSPSGRAGEDIYELIPIDHGYTLPSTISGLHDLYFEWLKWPQSKVPFDEDELHYIESLDASKDVSVLRHKFGDLISTECFKVLKITTMWLKTGAMVGLTPYTIGLAMCPKNPSTPSNLQKMCMEAQSLAAKQATDPDCYPGLPTITISACSPSPSSLPDDDGATANVIPGRSEHAFLENLKVVMERAALELLPSQIRPRSHSQLPPYTKTISQSRLRSQTISTMMN